MRYQRASTVGAVLGLIVVGVLSVGLVLETPGASASVHEDLAGDGTAENPYVLTNASELRAMEHAPAAHFELAGDVDASGLDGFEPIGSESAPFTGHLDGNGYAVTGLTIQASDANGVGLFAAVEDGTVENVRLEDADVSGGDRVGALVGVNAGTVENASATGQVSGGTDVGGLVGVADGSVARSTADVSVTGTRAVGGLVGLNERGPIADVRATGDVTGDDAVGGLVGENRCCIVRGVAAGPVSGSTAVGGAVGRHVGGSATDVYWDVDATGQSDSAVGTGLSTGELTGEAAAESLSSFDLAATWTTTDGYPDLQWRQDLPDESGGLQVAGYTARDLNGDGLYRDVNGNGRLDSDDVVTYFELIDHEDVRNNVAAFDYNENERIDFDDVVTLFEAL